MRREAEAAEKQVATLTNRLRDMDARLADPALYAGPAAAIVALQSDRDGAAAKLSEHEQAWLTTMAAIEAAERESEAA
jgi:ATP-binding cassette subfamily F protein 3